MAKAKKKLTEEPKPGSGLGRGKGRVPLKDEDRKTELLRLRLTPDQKAELEDSASKLGISVSRFVLESALKSARKQ